MTFLTRGNNPDHRYAVQGLDKGAWCDLGYSNDQLLGAVQIEDVLLQQPQCWSFEKRITRIYDQALQCVALPKHGMRVMLNTETYQRHIDQPTSKQYVYLAIEAADGRLNGTYDRHANRSVFHSLDAAVQHMVNHRITGRVTCHYRTHCLSDWNITIAYAYADPSADDCSQVMVTIDEVKAIHKPKSVIAAYRGPFTLPFAQALYNDVLGKDPYTPETLQLVRQGLGYNLATIGVF